MNETREEKIIKFIKDNCRILCFSFLCLLILFAISTPDKIKTKVAETTQYAAPTVEVKIVTEEEKEKLSIERERRSEKYKRELKEYQMKRMREDLNGFNRDTGRYYWERPMSD